MSKVPQPRKGGQTGGGGRHGHSGSRERSASRGGNPYRGGGGSGKKPPGKSSFASPEMVKAAYITAAIPAVAILSIAGYFGYHAFGGI